MSAGRNVDLPLELQTQLQRLNPARPPPASRPGSMRLELSPPSSSFMPLHRGFKDRFVQPLEPKYCCESCKLALCNPRQTECGHRFCESCIRDLLCILQGDAFNCSWKVTPERGEPRCRSMEDVKTELQERYKVLPSLNTRIIELENRYKEVREKSKEMEQKISNVQKLLGSHSEKVMEMEMELRLLRQAKDEVETLKSTVESIRSRVAVLEGSGRGGGGAGTHALGKSLYHLTLHQPIITCPLETQLARHDDMLSVHEIRLADMDLRFQVLETASYSGTLVWKIRDYKRRKQEAVMGKTLSLYSQPFYTGYFGYRMCARVYLNGDGMGKGTHLSLFFVVMRGEYDALLPWPFKQKVTLMLMDQGPARKHLGDAFKPDPNSSSFKRPAGDMNIASGCPLFVAQTVLENGTYIKDDTIFIKVVVDASDLPDP
ncbi:UNVERIFIED_CONTAM: hypothetical protein FKN15_011853 [Acipenser sinensis]